jgi:hypothetical protein
MQEVAMLLLGNRSQMVDVIAAAANQGLAMVLSIKFCLITRTYLMLPSILMEDQYGNHMSICGDLIDSDSQFLNWIITED